MSDKATLEKEHSESMNQSAVDRIKAEEEEEAKSLEAKKAELEAKEAAIFEDDTPIKLRDGKQYFVPPLSLKNARSLMKKLQTVNVDVIILNFIPTGDVEADINREQDLFDILLMAFVNYPAVDRDYLDSYVDVETARKIVDVLLGLNAIKK